MNAVELCVGAGGLALGAAKAGFRHLAVIEDDHSACQTLRENRRQGHPLVAGWPIHEVDVRDFDYRSILTSVDLLSAGVPCQPFSVAGKARAHRDKRDLFAEVVRAARILRPKAILIENVRGLRRSKFKEYLEYILLALASPELARDPKQSWRDHFKALIKQGAMPTVRKPLRYDVYIHLVNAADYGVPQCRERVFIVAFRSDLEIQWQLPKPTHSLLALAWDQWKTGNYWRRHRLQRRRPGRVSRRMASAIDSINESDLESPLLPWNTIRDAQRGLPGARRDAKARHPSNHVFNPGARSYKGHSGSLIDEPAKTLKAGSHGVPGGENSLIISGRKIRYFSVRECARFQSFPDEYIFVGSWASMMRQIGNAVPVRLAEVITGAIRRHLELTAISRRTPKIANIEVGQVRNAC